jgi:hypothetical protein
LEAGSQNVAGHHRNPFRAMGQTLCSIVLSQA